MYEQNNRTYLKVWLIDGSVNKNDWGVTPDSIPQNINTAIGKPLIIYKNTGEEPDANRRRVGDYDHPYLAGADSVDHALAYQDLFRVGTFIDVFESNTKPNEWWGIAEITDDDTVRAMREDRNLPLYVSPMIHLQDPTEPENAHRHWSFIHSAIVGTPAYGSAKAYISGHCSGSQQTCMLQLRKAAKDKNPEKQATCGFCRYKAVKEIQSSIRAASVPIVRPKSLSSLEKNREQLQFRNSTLSGDNNQDNKNGQQTQESDSQNNNNQEQNQQAQTKVETKTRRIADNPQTGAQQAVEETNITTTESKKEGNNNNTKQASTSESSVIERLSVEKRNLEIQLDQARADLQTHKSLNEQFNARLASLEQERDNVRAEARQREIVNFVNTAPAYQLLTPQQRQEQIETFVKGSMSVDELRNITQPLNDAVAKNSPMLNRGASYSAIRSTRLQLGTPEKSIEVRAASQNNNEPIVDDVPYWFVKPSGLHNNSSGRGGVQ